MDLVNKLRGLVRSRKRRMYCYEPPRVTGSVRLEVIRDGRVIETREGSNRIVDAGLVWLSGALTGDVADATVMKYIALGTGSTAAADGDTAMETPVEARATGTQSKTYAAAETGPPAVASYVTYQVVGTITMTAARALREVGLLSASSDGTLFARQVYDVINLAEGDSMQVTWTITIAKGA